MPNLVAGDTMRIEPFSDLTFGDGALWQRDEFGRIIPADGTTGDVVTQLSADVVLIGQLDDLYTGFGSDIGEYFGV